MVLKLWRVVTLLLAALSLTAESAHVLEMPQKLAYDAKMYTAVNATLYKYFAIVGGSWQVSAIIAAGLLAVATRGRRPAYGWTVTGAGLLLAAFMVWAAAVAPVNGTIADAIGQQPASVPGLWMDLRNRWEYGHAAGFALQLLGLSALVISVVLETPRHAYRK
jgi:hypothetical protein